MTKEDDFHKELDAEADDWQTRLVLADFLDDRGDPRAAGYRAIAVQRRYPLQGAYRGKVAWWWHSYLRANTSDFHNVVPHDWFALLPTGEGTAQFWPVFNEMGRVRTRRECEDALALAFAKLPAIRQAELLASPAEDPTT